MLSRLNPEPLDAGESICSAPIGAPGPELNRWVARIGCAGRRFFHMRVESVRSVPSGDSASSPVRSSAEPGRDARARRVRHDLCFEKRIELTGRAT